MVNENALNPTFAVGEIVEETGFYICVPCGNKVFLKKGATFPRCLGCLTAQQKKSIVKDMELWERVRK